MKKIILLILICALSKQNLFSQKIYNTWFFGYRTGLDFNSSPPAALDNPLISANEPPYYTSSICDTSGKLLFFTNGFRVWNAARQEMPKLSNKWPWEFNDQVLPLICPYPGNDSLYYLFTVGKAAKDAETNGGPSLNVRKLLFTTINMAANGHTGGIVYPQPSTLTNYFTVLANNASFMLAGTAHCNQRDEWIVTIANGALNNFLVSPGGVANTPVTTALSIPQSAFDDGYSNIKFSANGEKLVIPIVRQAEVMVLDFNNQTGTFSNPVLLHLPSPEILQDVELSPTGNKLYYGSYVEEMEAGSPTGLEFHSIYQLDLTAGSSTDIENSRYRLNSFPERGGCPYQCYIIHRTLQLGPDGKIYCSMRDAGSLDKRITVIEFPERDRGSAGFVGGEIAVSNVYKFINVSYIRSGSFSPKENGIQARKKICLGLPTEFSLFYSRVDSVKWDFGDPGSGANNFSSAFAPSHNYTSVNRYTVTAIIYKACHVDTATLQVAIEPDPIVKLPVSVEDTLVCVGNKLQMNVTTPNATGYFWSDGFMKPQREISSPGTYDVRAFNACSEDEKSFTVKIEKCPCDIFVPSGFTPNHDGRNDQFKPVVQCAAKNYRFKIFNRYGNLLFETNELNKGWDGEYKNNMLPTGVYVWILEYRNPNDNQITRKHGSVALIR